MVSCLVPIDIRGQERSLAWEVTLHFSQYVPQEVIGGKSAYISTCYQRATGLYWEGFEFRRELPSLSATLQLWTRSKKSTQLNFGEHNGVARQARHFTLLSVYFLVSRFNPSFKRLGKVVSTCRHSASSANCPISLYHTVHLGIGPKQTQPL